MYGPKQGLRLNGSYNTVEWHVYPDYVTGSKNTEPGATKLLLMFIARLKLDNLGRERFQILRFQLMTNLSVLRKAGQYREQSLRRSESDCLNIGTSTYWMGWQE